MRNGDAALYAVPIDGFEPVPGEAVDQYASMGSATHSMLSGMEEDGISLAPSIVDIKRLQKLKADQDMRLKALCTRVDRLTAQEQRVWKDVAYTQQRSLQAQEKQWQKQAQEADKLRMERELMIQEQALHERASEMRLRSLEMKDLPRLQKFEENKMSSSAVREEGRRNAASIHNLQKREMQSRSMQVELRRQQRRQQKLQKELVQTRQEQARQDVNMQRFAELQEEIQNAELAIAVAEREELSAVSRLQSSQTVRSEVVTQLQDIEKLHTPRSGHLIDDEFDGVASPPCAPPPPMTVAQPQQLRPGMPSARNNVTRSSPRLGYSGGSAGAAPPPPPQSARPQRMGMYGGSRSASGLGAMSAGRADLCQITEEEAAHDSKAAAKKTSSGPRTRALQMQRARQSPRPYSANAQPTRPQMAAAGPRGMQDRGHY